MDELKNIAPNLSGIPKNDNDFKVPDKYFEAFPDKIMDKIKSGKEQEGRNKRSVIMYLKPYLAVAATLLGIFLAWQIIIDVSMTESPVEQEANSEYDIEYELLSVDEEMIVEYMSDSNYPGNNALSSVESSEIIDYLSQDNLDEYVLINEL
jgi:hypothetical protein